VSGLDNEAPTAVEDAAELSAAIAGARARVEVQLAEAQRAASAVRQARGRGDRSADRDATEAFELAKRRAVREAQTMRVATAEQLALAQSLVEAAKALSVASEDGPALPGTGAILTSRDHARRRGMRR
jgi:hypothetical protein